MNCSANKGVKTSIVLLKNFGVNEQSVVEGKEESGASGNPQGAVLVVLRGV
jgi:hypothetical protein